MAATASTAPITDTFDALVGEALNRSTVVFFAPAPVRLALKKARALRAGLEESLTLVAGLATELPAACLRAQTRDEYLASLAGGLSSYCQAVAAFAFLRGYAQEGAAQEGEGSLRADLIEESTRVAGEDAGDEAAFAWETYERALRLCSALGSQEATDPRRDSQLSREFTGYGILFAFAHATILMLRHADSGQPSAAAIATTFEVLRTGALRAYAAVSEATRLLRPVMSVSDQPLPFDAEDAWLAGC